MSKASDASEANHLNEMKHSESRCSATPKSQKSSKRKQTFLPYQSRDTAVASKISRSYTVGQLESHKLLTESIKEKKDVLKMRPFWKVSKL